MHMHREHQNLQSVQSYNESQVVIQGMSYSESFIVGQGSILSPWSVRSLDDLSTDDLAWVIDQKPELILLGQSHPRLHCPVLVRQHVMAQRIGLECMGIGAACRTFNLLLQEHRVVFLGIIFS